MDGLKQQKLNRLTVLVSRNLKSRCLLHCALPEGSGGDVFLAFIASLVFLGWRLRYSTHMAEPFFCAFFHSFLLMCVHLLG